MEAGARFVKSLLFSYMLHASIRPTQYSSNPRLDVQCVPVAIYFDSRKAGVVTRNRKNYERCKLHNECTSVLAL